MKRIRGKGRNDWPCEAMWNSFVASFLFEHETVESLLRELRRNKQLRTLCGFEPKTVRQRDGSIKVYVAPSKSAYSNFLKNLMECQKELDEMFTGMVLFMYGHLEHFGVGDKGYDSTKLITWLEGKGNYKNVKYHEKKNRTAYSFLTPYLVYSF